MTVGNNPLLTSIQPRGPAKLLALPPGPLDALIRAFADQATLELGNAAADFGWRCPLRVCGKATEPFVADMAIEPGRRSTALAAIDRGNPGRSIVLVP